MTLNGAKKKLKDNRNETENNFELIKKLEEIKSVLNEIKNEL